MKSDPQVYECKLTANTRYTAQSDSKMVKLTRYNRDGETVLFIPVSLIWDLMRDTFRERLHKRIEHLFLKDFFL